MSRNALTLANGLAPINVKELDFMAKGVGLTKILEPPRIHYELKVVRAK